MIRFKNPFSFDDYTEQERKEIELKKAEIKLKTDSARDALLECISSDSFKKYRSELEKADSALIESGIEIMRKVKSKDERLFLYDQIFARAEVLGLLLKGVEKDRIMLYEKP